MSTLPELLAQHAVVNEQYCKLFAANQAVSKRLQDARKARSAVRKSIAAVVGQIPDGTLVMTHTGNRFFEVRCAVSAGYFTATPVYQTTGERKTEGKNTQFAYVATRPVECWSVVPVPKDHPIYLKWEKRRFRDKLEGKE